MTGPRVLKQPEHPYVWGIDVSTQYIAIGIVGQDRAQANRVKLEKLEHPAERLHMARRRILSFTKALASHFPPALVYVERPTGHRDRTPLILVQMAAVAQCAVYDALADHFVQPVPVREVAVASWKKRSVGFGNASKDQVMAWCREQFGYRGSSQDEADSMAIAYCAFNALHEVAEAA